jgi:beta-1,2-mannobiose phosphorylase / 1,2-beta-oligomannan phosphorylase
MINGSAQLNHRDLGVALLSGRVFLYSNLSRNTANTFQVGVSTDGLSFKKHLKQPSIVDTAGTPEDTKQCRDFRISSFGKDHILLYKTIGHHPHLMAARSKDGVVWKKIGTIHSLHETTMIVPDFKYEGKYVAYSGEGDIKVAYSTDLKTWAVAPEALITPRLRAYDKFPLEVGTVMVTERGILVLYFTKQYKRENERYAVGAALFDLKDPARLLWRADEPVWEQPAEWHEKVVYPMGALKVQEKFILYFGIERESVTAIAFSNFDEVFNLTAATATQPVLKKHAQNPIISPVMRHAWESMSTFNPAAVYDNDKVHLLYRAQGDSATSTIGYATSSDGVTIDERYDEPIYYPTQPFETPGGTPFHPNLLFMSGGGWGGVEDPRITKIEDKFYLTYVAYNGRDHPRVALSSIEVEDFRQQRWDKWATPKLISPPGVVDKNACIFPEKVNGKYVVMHRIFPNILIDFLDDLDFETMKYLKGEHKIAPRENSWDSRKAGAGPPPIKTKDGWLLIYHAVDDRDDKQYQIGAMLLDLYDPTKVLYRSTVPILKPTEWYENEGFKAGVAYPCGAVVIKNKLYVYYGGADSYVCVAARDLDQFLKELKTSSPVTVPQIPSSRKVLAHAYF